MLTVPGPLYLRLSNLHLLIPHEYRINILHCCHHTITNMCKSPSHDFLKSLPKCELHMHVEGSLLPETLFELARRNKITLPQDDPAYASKEALAERYKHFTSLDDFLHYYYTGMSTLIHQSDYEDLAWSYFQKAHEDGVVHAEIFFDPQAHTGRGIALSVVIEGLQAARRKAHEQLNMSTELISCFLRHEPVSSALSLFKSKDLQDAFANRSICGIGLDSSEKAYPPELFQEVYDKAKALGLKMTAHAGEEGPVENIRTSLEQLKCHRIDHGLRLPEDEHLMKELATMGTLLTLCPLSNLSLGSYDHVNQAPVRKFLDAGVQFCINSDDPTYLGGFILDNYCAVQDAFGLTIAEWERITSAAIDGSWCSTQRKIELHDILRKHIEAAT